MLGRGHIRSVPCVLRINLKLIVNYLSYSVID
jgi:hypothetical protein